MDSLDRSLQPVEGNPRSGGFAEAFIFPFRQPNALAKLWWVPVVCLVPFLNLLAIKGWRLEIVRRRIAGHADIVPEAADLARFMADGFWLIVAGLVYHLPLIVILGTAIPEMINELIDNWHEIVTGLTNSHFNIVTVAMIFFQLAFRIVVEFAAPVIVHYLLKPFLYAGMLRYARTRRVTSLFNIGAQFRMVFGNLGGFLKLTLFCALAGIIINLFSVMVLSTFLGAALIPLICIPMYNLASGYFLADLAQE